MSVLVIQNDPIVPVGQLSAFLGGHEVVRAWEDPQRLQDLAAAPLPGALILLGGRANAYDARRARGWKQNAHSCAAASSHTSGCSVFAWAPS